MKEDPDLKPDVVELVTKLFWKDHYNCHTDPHQELDREVGSTFTRKLNPVVPENIDLNLVNVFSSGTKIESQTDFKLDLVPPVKVENTEDEAPSTDPPHELDCKIGIVSTLKLNPVVQDNVDLNLVNVFSSGTKIESCTDFKLDLVPPVKIENTEDEAPSTDPPQELDCKVGIAFLPKLNPVVPENVNLNLVDVLSSGTKIESETGFMLDLVPPVKVENTKDEALSTGSYEKIVCPVPSVSSVNLFPIVLLERLDLNSLSGFFSSATTSSANTNHDPVLANNGQIASSAAPSVSTEKSAASLLQERGETLKKVRTKVNFICDKETAELAPPVGSQKIGLKDSLQTTSNKISLQKEGVQMFRTQDNYSFVTEKISSIIGNPADANHVTVMKCCDVSSSKPAFKNDSNVSCDKGSSSRNIPTESSGESNTERCMDASNPEKKETFFRNKCPSMFENSSGPKTYPPVLSDVRPFACKQCPAHFKLESALKRHLPVHSDERPFSCKQCLARFKTKDSLLGHAQTHSNKRPFSCKLCLACFKTKEALLSHTWTHSDKRPFSCEKCSERFKTKAALKQHMSVHTDEKPFSCKLCTKVYKSNGALSLHLRTHSEERPFSCKQCPARFKFQSYLDVHYLRHSDERPFACEQCPARFKRKILMSRHRLTHSDERPVSCKQCSARFKTIADLNGHLIVHSDEKPFACTQCSWRFKKNRDLIRHLRTHSNERPFTCEHCIARFTSKGLLRSHLRSHSNVKPFSCEQCSTRFKTRIELNRHLDTHSNKKSVPCKQCSQQFKSKRNLLQHVRSAHAERVFSCEQCSAQFKSKLNLKQHLYTHSDTKLFSCEQCSARFKSKSALVIHLRVHSGERPFSCEQCPGRFKTSGELNAHLRVHSDKRPFSCELCSACFKSKGRIAVHMERVHCDEKFSCERCSESFKLKRNLIYHIRTHSED